MTEDDFQFAIENTQVIRVPDRRIATFGSTVFRFYLVSELMDSVDQIRVRNGKIHAERPQVLSPHHYAHLLLEGFGDEAQEFARILEQQQGRLAILKYGFQVRKTEVVEDIVRDKVEAVIDRVQQRVEESGEPLSTVIQGVDDAWEVCLLKFTVDLIQRSSGDNLSDLRGKGLL